MASNGNKSSSRKNIHDKTSNHSGFKNTSAGFGVRLHPINKEDSVCGEDSDGQAAIGSGNSRQQAGKPVRIKGFNSTHDLHSTR